MMKYGFSQSGASLTDTLVALAIVGCLLSFGLPAFKTHIQETERKSVQKLLLTYSLKQESFRLTHFRYGTAKEVSVPSNKDFHIEVMNLTEQTFLLVAVSNDKTEAKKRCGRFSINQLLERMPLVCW